MHRSQNLVKGLVGVHPAVDDQVELLRGHVEVLQALEQGIEHIGERVHVVPVPLGHLEVVWDPNTVGAIFVRPEEDRRD